MDADTYRICDAIDCTDLRPIIADETHSWASIISIEYGLCERRTDQSTCGLNVTCSSVWHKDSSLGPLP